MTDSIRNEERLRPKYRGRNGFVYFDGIREPVIEVKNLWGAAFSGGDLATLLAEKLNHEMLCSGESKS